MAVGYVLTKRGTPGNPTSTKRWYAQTQAVNVMGFYDLAKEIEWACSATRGDVELVLDALIAVMERHLAQGEDISLGDFGRFRMTILNTKPYIEVNVEEGDLRKVYPAPTERDKFDPIRNITRSYVRFFPGKELRNMCKTATFRLLKGGTAVTTPTP